MLAVRVRSGLVEALHDGAVAVHDARVGLVASSGEIDRPFYLRSAAKPFQAMAAQRAGASLSPLQLAMACASHRGLPVQVALVESMLDEAGLTESSLGCPADWPVAPGAARRVVSDGAIEPRRLWHNCSGKHAGFLRACVARGWPLGSYLDPEHPLQRSVIETVTEMSEFPAEPVGVDGCGAPVLRTTTRAMARLFSCLSSDPDLVEVFAAMHRYPALIAVNGAPDTQIAIATHGAAKGGAVGCIGVALAGGRAVAVKCWDGSFVAAGVATTAALEEMGAVPAGGPPDLAAVGRPEVLGGGEPHGAVESRLELRWE